MCIVWRLLLQQNEIQKNIKLEKNAEWRNVGVYLDFLLVLSFLKRRLVYFRGTLRFDKRQPLWEYSTEHFACSLKNVHDK